MPTPRTPTIAPFPTDPVLTGIVIAYRNPKLIADQVMPRVPVGSTEYRYHKYAAEDRFTLPESRVGRRSRPNTTEFGATEDVGLCAWNALDAAVPNADIDAGARAGFDPVAQGVETNIELIRLGREKRVASKVFSAATYPVGRKTTVAGNDRWFHASSDPIAQILSARNAMIMPGNLLVLGHQTWQYLSTNAAIVAAINRNQGTKGIVRREAVAELFELDQILVGSGMINTAKPGQALNLARVWGNHAALLYVDPKANSTKSITWGFTAQYGGPLGGQWEDKDIGAEGGIRARCGECLDEKVCAPDLGYFFENAGDAS